MNIKWILFIVSLLTALGPIVAAVVLHQDNLLELLGDPEDLEKVQRKFESLSRNPPNVTDWHYTASSTGSYYEGTFTLEIDNPSNLDLVINSFEAKIYCHDHNVRLGKVNLINSTTIKTGTNYWIYVP